MDPCLPLDCSALLPHRETMRLAGTLVEHGPDTVVVTAAIDPAGIFVDARGVLDPAAMIELVAQASAVLKGYEARLRGDRVRIGYLAGIKEFSLRDEARAGDELTIVARQEFAMEQVSLMRGEVSRGGRLLGAGTLKVWEEKDWPRASLPPEAAPSRDLAQTGLDFKPILLDDAALDPIGRALTGALEGIEPCASENQVAGWFRFGEDFLGFRGHFPDFPILPAVLMPRLALALATLLLGRPLTLSAVEQAKISHGIFPGQRVRVEATLEGAARLKARLTGPAGAVATFAMRIAPRTD